MPYGEGLQRVFQKGGSGGGNRRAKGNWHMSKESNTGCILVGMLDIKGQDHCKRVYSIKGIAPTLLTCGGGSST